MILESSAEADGVPARAPLVDEASDRDAGSALILVLVLMVIASLIVVPTMTYAMTVMRANTSLSDKSKRLEAVKAGLRVALADPKSLYDTCDEGGQTVAVDIAGLTLGDVAVSTRCYFIDYASAQSAEQIRYGLTATRLGSVPPDGLSGFKAPVTSTTNEWWSQTSLLSETNKIWFPNLPTHGLDRRSSAGTQMPSGYPTCTVYFPGTYPDPVVLSGPTYFTSGIYYFEDEVRIIGGASVVVGLGATTGCTTDQEAVFYAQNVPGTHNMSGLGGTWVLGKKARVVVSNSNNAELSLRFNTRYVANGESGDAPSADVSIISVNGELAPDGVTGVALDLPGVIAVPASLVGSVAPVAATQQGYLPSVHTPKPVRPDAPTAPTATRFVGAALIAWSAPYDGGSPITGYTVTASTGPTCTTSGATTCAMTGLSSSSTTFTVVATNAVGASLPSVASAPVTPGGSTSLVVPTKPAVPSVTPYAGNTVRVSWVAPADGGAPIKSYTVTASPGGAGCTVNVAVAVPPPLSCDITGLNPLQLVPGYTFTVTATNAVGVSTASNPSAQVLGSAFLLAPVAPPLTVPVTTSTYRSILDIDLPSTSAVSIDIPGYVAVPQGRFQLSNPNGLNVRLTGGILASEFGVVDSRIAPPTAAPIPVGFVETEVQRKFRIVSTTSQGSETSTAIVQVNQNGAYAVNSWEVQ